jgi:hypothetical protein
MVLTCPLCWNMKEMRAGRAEGLPEVSMEEGYPICLGCGFVIQTNFDFDFGNESHANRLQTAAPTSRTRIEANDSNATISSASNPYQVMRSRTAANLIQKHSTQSTNFTYTSRKEKLLKDKLMCSLDRPPLYLSLSNIESIVSLCLRLLDCQSQSPQLNNTVPSAQLEQTTTISLPTTSNDGSSYSVNSVSTNHRNHPHPQLDNAVYSLLAIAHNEIDTQYDHELNFNPRSPVENSVNLNQERTKIRTGRMYCFDPVMSSKLLF